MAYGSDANTGAIVQAAAVLNAINSQMKTGTLANVDLSNYDSVAQTTLQVGTDALATAISQVVGKTIIGVRPYTGAFKVVSRDNQQYGLITRKLNYPDLGIEDGAQFGLVDGQSVDQYAVKLPKTIETRFYGAHDHAAHRSVLEDQLNGSFETPAGLASWYGGFMTNVENEIEGYREADRRACVLNAVAGVNALNAANQVINLRTAYNTATGQSLTLTDLFNAANFVPFVKWMYAEIKYYMDLMKERSYKFHYNVSAGNIARHTDAANMVSIWNSKLLGQIHASVLSGVFQENELKPFAHEEVPYWQSIDDPYGIKIKPAIITAAGAKTAGTNQTMTNVIGVLMDKDMCGVTDISERFGATPMNQKGGYYNLWWNFTGRTWCDFTENCIVFTLN